MAYPYYNSSPLKIMSLKVTFLTASKVSQLKTSSGNNCKQLQPPFQNIVLTKSNTKFSHLPCIRCPFQILIHQQSDSYPITRTLQSWWRTDTNNTKLDAEPFGFSTINFIFDVMIWHWGKVSIRKFVRITVKWLNSPFPIRLSFEDYW